MSETEIKNPRVIVLAGPNGAGKSTAAPELLRGLLRVPEFVNADVIAQGLSGFNPERAAFQAGRVMLLRLKELAAERQDFAFETTLASRSFAPWIESLSALGYSFHLFFLWLPSADMAIQRVAARVQSGGHDIPPDTIRRRYDRGLRNFFSLYRRLADDWGMYNNSVVGNLRLIASGAHTQEAVIADDALWAALRDMWDEDPDEHHRNQAEE